MIKSTPIFTISSFNQQNWNAALKKQFPLVPVSSGEYGQMIPYLLELNNQQVRHEYCICWLSLRDVFEANTMKLDLAALVLKLNSAFAFSVVILPSVDSPTFNVFQGVDLREQLYELNLRISTGAKGKNIAVLDPTPWMIHQGANSVSSQLWYLSKTPYHKNIFIQAAAACSSTFNAIAGRSKKVLVLDLDDTLWGGIVGDEGWENLKIGGHDPIGEA